MHSLLVLLVLVSMASAFVPSIRVMRTSQGKRCVSRAVEASPLLRAVIPAWLHALCFFASSSANPNPATTLSPNLQRSMPSSR